MNGEITIPAIILGLGLAWVLAIWPIETSFAAARRQGMRNLAAKHPDRRDVFLALANLPFGPTAGLTVLRVLALSAAIASAASLLLTRTEVGWLLLGGTCLGFLLFTTSAHAIAGAVAGAYGERLTVASSATVLWTCRFLYPLAWAQQRLIWILMAATGRHRQDEGDDALSDVPLSLTSDGEPLDETERRMIRGVITLDDTSAREIMIPRPDMVAAEIGTPISELADTMLSAGHSRIPIFEGSLDNILGVAYARDILQRFSQGTEGAVVGTNVVRPVLFIPEAKNLGELLEEFKSSRVHMAIVIDEYGGVSGLVTIEDLLEEIVGEIMDEFDLERQDVRPLSETEFLLDAGIGIDDLRELVGVAVKGNGFDTLGGLVFERLGKIPSPGDIVDEHGVQIRVISTEGRRPKTLRVTKVFQAEQRKERESV